MARHSPERKYPRLPCERPLRFVLGRQTLLDGVSRDFSRYGIGATIPQKIQPGQYVAIEIPRALGPASLLLAAMVRWRNHDEHGLELLNPSPFQQRILTQLAESKLP